MKTGVKPEYKNVVNSFTPLMQFMTDHDAKSLQERLALDNSDINDKNIGEESALIYACLFYNSEELIKILLKNGADPNLGHSFGYTALVYATEYSTVETVKILLLAGANPVPNSNDVWADPLISISCNKNTEIMATLAKLLLRAIDPKVAHTWYHTILIEVIYNWIPPINLKVIKILLSTDINLNFQNYVGYTALITAVRNYDESPKEELIKMLLRGGADPHVQNYDGKTAIDIAKEFCNPEYEKILQDFVKLESNYPILIWIFSQTGSGPRINRWFLKSLFEDYAGTYEDCDDSDVLDG